jgi:hypothetical protein
MNRVVNRIKAVSLLIMVFAILLPGCKVKPTPTTYTTTTPPAAYSLYQLEYRLFAKYPTIFWCDPDFYPISRVGEEQQNAGIQFPKIKSIQSEFSVILAYLNLPEKNDYTDNEKLLIYREYKKLMFAVQMTASEQGYNFDLRVGQGYGERIQGTIKTSGEIQEASREASYNTCPICLVKGTLIDTPQGQIPVEQLSKGMMIRTIDDSGNRAATEIIETAATNVPSDFTVIRIELNDGRTITASPGHPTAEGRAIIDYHIGDSLDGAKVAAISEIKYENGKTYDILPDGATGFYWANGILLGSTLKK